MPTVRAGTSARWSASAPLAAGLRARTPTAEPADRPARARWGASTAQRTPHAARWPAAQAQDAAHRAAWAGRAAPPARALLLAPWLPAKARDASARVRWPAQTQPPGRALLIAAWPAAQRADTTTEARWAGRGAAATRNGAMARWVAGRPADVFRQHPWGGFSRPLPAGWMVVAPTPPADAAAVVPQLGVYIVINALSLRTVPGAVDMPTLAFTMALDADSWTWSWSATVHRSAEALAQPGAIVEAVVNGAAYRLVIERVARADEFPTRRLSVGGRGLAANLAAPQAVERAYSVASTMTAQQLAADVLSANGVPLGWAVDWGIEDWLVPASAWSFQGAPIDAVVDIASAAGAIVQPHPTEQVLRVRARYPHLPWQWSGVSPDVDLPASLIQVEGVEWVRKPAYNRVFVGGVGLGVFGPVTRDGTAGDLVARQINHPLITAPAAHRQRGSAALADTGRQVHLTLSMPVIEPIGVIVPGSLVRYTGDVTRIGMVRSTSVSWSTPVVRQTIGVECHAE